MSPTVSEIKLHSTKNKNDNEVGCAGSVAFIVTRTGFGEYVNIPA